MNESEIKTKVMANNVIQRMVIESQVYLIPTLYTRVFHKNTFLKEKVVHTLTTPYRAYINHIQKISFLGQV